MVCPICAGREITALLPAVLLPVTDADWRGYRGHDKKTLESSLLSGSAMVRNPIRNHPFFKRPSRVDHG